MVIIGVVGVVVVSLAIEISISQREKGVCSGCAVCGQWY
jgi:hypothetical protein